MFLQQWNNSDKKIAEHLAEMLNLYFSVQLFSVYVNSELDESFCLLLSAFL